jgi:glycerol kinase
LLEAICLQTADVSDAMRSDVLRARLQLSQSELRVDGGASSNSLLLRVLADTLGLRVLRPENNETTSLGAALAAGVALELWSASDVFTMPIYGGVAEFVPSLGQGEREARRRRWASAVSRCLAWTRVPPPLLLETGRRASTVVPCLLFGAIAGAALARWWPRFK